jgi:hypothetical protein
MTFEEYQKEEEAIEAEALRAKRKLLHSFAIKNQKYKVGDILMWKMANIVIRVEKVTFGAWRLRNGIPSTAFYHGTRLRKDLKTYTKKTVGHIAQPNVSAKLN